jgi:hypothetical protein
MASNLTLGRARVWRMRNSVLAVVLLGIATLQVFASDAGGSKPGEGVPKPDYSQEPYVVEHVQRRIRFETDGTGQREAIVRVRVQNEAGVRQWGQLMFGYNSANERIEIPYVRVVKADNSVITAAARCHPRPNLSVSGSNLRFQDLAARSRRKPRKDSASGNSFLPKLDRGLLLCTGIARRCEVGKLAAKSPSKERDEAAYIRLYVRIPLKAI